MKRLVRNVSGILLIGTFSFSVAAPIRVGILKGTGTNRYFHTSMHTGSAAIAAMLASPAQAGLENPFIPVQGFAVTLYGIDSSCNASGCKPSPDQLSAFMAALDSLNVVVIPNFVDIGSSISSTTQRARFETFSRSRGLISMHWSADSYGTWPQWDSLNGTRFQNKPSSDRDGTLHLDTAGTSQRLPSWRFLNRGLPDTARFVEEWLSFTTNGDVIRSQPFLIPTVNIDESSYAGGLGGARVMGADHPMSWYREFPQGGRFFYTGLGHRTQTYQNVYFFRRQLYNAILWAAGADSNGVVTSLRTGRASAGGPLKTWVSGSRIHVQVAEKNATVELRLFDGGLLARKKASAAGTVAIEKPAGSGALIVRVRGLNGTQSALVAP